MHLDPRRGAPSASELPRLSKCLASARLSREAKEKGLEPPESEDASSGTRVHAYLHTGDGWDELTMEEQDTAARCEAAEKHLADEWIDDAPVAPITIYREMRLGLTSMGTVVEVTPESKAQFCFTGAADSIWVCGDRGAIWDYKTGRNEATEATGNKQLLGLAVLAAKRWKLKSMRVAIIQPHCGPASVADYDFGNLEDAEAWLMGILEKVKNPLLKLTPDGHGSHTATFAEDPIPSDACRWCAGRVICPAKNQNLAVAECISPATLPPEKTKEAVWARVHDFGNDDLASILDDPRFKYVAWLMEAAKGVALKRLKDAPGCIPGWEAREVEGKRSVSEPEQAYALSGLTPEQFMSACTVSLPKIEEAIRVASGKKTATRYNKTQQQAKDELSAKIGHLITRKRSTRLAKVGQELEEES